MRKRILRFKLRDRNNFEEVRSGLKSIETRAATPRHRDIKTGDVIVFVCGDKRFEKKVRKVKVFKNIRAMLMAIDYKKIMPSIESASEMQKIYYSYPNYKEKIKKFGIVALELE